MHARTKVILKFKANYSSSIKSNKMFIWDPNHMVHQTIQTKTSNISTTIKPIL